MDGVSMLEDGAPSCEGGGTSRGSGKSSKLDSVLEKLQPPATSLDHSRENSPDPSASVKDTSLASSSSRRRSRKPAVIRKVVESEDEDSQAYMADMEEPAIPVIEYENSEPQGVTNHEPEGKDNEQDGTPMETIDIDEHGNYILPEGTVVVEPEDVEEEKDFSGPEFRSGRKKKQAKDDNEIISCSACNKQINQHVTGALRRHPVLKVLICKKCYNWYTSDEFDQDTDGCDNQCRWCGEGGDLLCCDYCHNAFCKTCIKRNLGRTELANLLQQDDDAKWHCYVCNPKPLASLIQYCDNVIKSVDESKKHQRQKEKRDSRRDSTVGKGSPSKGKDSAHATPKNSQKRSHKPDSVVKTKPGLPANLAGPEILITPANVPEVLGRLMAAIQSMNTLMESFKDDLRGQSRNGPPTNKIKAQVEVSKKLTRAYLMFKQSLKDIEIFSRSSNVSPRPVGQAIKHASGVLKRNIVDASRVPQNLVFTDKDGQQRTVFQVIGGTIVGTNPSLKQKTPKHQVKEDEVIELSDSSDEDFEPAKMKKSPQKKNMSGKRGMNSEEQDKETSESADLSTNRTDVASEHSVKKKSFNLRISLEGRRHGSGHVPEDSDSNSATVDDTKGERTSDIGKESQVESKQDLEKHSVKGKCNSDRNKDNREINGQECTTGETALEEEKSIKGAQSTDPEELDTISELFGDDSGIKHMPKKDKLENDTEKKNAEETLDVLTEKKGCEEEVLMITCKESSENIDSEDEKEKLEINENKEVEGTKCNDKNKNANETKLFNEEKCLNESEKNGMKVGVTDKENVGINVTNGFEEGNIAQLDGAHHDGEKHSPDRSSKVSRRMKTTPRKRKVGSPRLRSRDDIEAQRILHRELMEDSDDDDNSDDDSQPDILESSDSSEPQKSSGEEYDPEEDQWRNKSSRLKNRSKAKRKKDSSDSDASDKRSKRKRKCLESKREVLDDEYSKNGVKSKNDKREVHSEDSSVSDDSSENLKSKDSKGSQKTKEDVNACDTEDEVLENYMENTDNEDQNSKKIGKEIENISDIESSEEEPSPSRKKKKKRDSDSDFLPDNNKETKKKKVPTATLR